MSGELPQGWNNIALGELTQPNRPRRNPKDYPRLRFIGMEQVESHTRRLLGTLPSSEVKSTAFHFQPGDVLYGRLRPYLNKVLVVDFEGLCSSEFIVLPLDDSFDPRYLACYLSNNEFIAFANQLNQGDRPRVHFDQISEHEIPLPPPSEQQRIVAKLQQLSERVETCQQRLAKIPALLKRFRQSVLTAACSGRLTADWREEDSDTQSASDCLQAHAKRTVRRERNTRRMKPARGLTLLDYSEEIPTTWAWFKVRELVELGAIIDVQDGNHGELYPRAHDFGDVGVPYISAEHVINDRVQISSAPRLKREKAKELRIGFAKANDVILTHNATVGRVGILPPDSPDVVLSTSTTYYRVDEAVLLSLYLASFLRSRYFQSQLETLMEQTTRNQVSVTKQVELGIALPPLPEQQEIVRRVEKLFKLADQIEARFAEAQKRIDSIGQSVLAKAFRGELVPTEYELAQAEGRPFESADQLLERLQKNGQVNAVKAKK
jgi:type I restriction enzyme S subunit